MEEEQHGRKLRSRKERRDERVGWREEGEE